MITCNEQADGKRVFVLFADIVQHCKVKTTKLRMIGRDTDFVLTTRI